MEISKIERVLTIYMVKPEIVCAILLWELQKIWVMFSFGDAIFLVFSSLRLLAMVYWIYLVAGPFLTMLNVLLHVFVRDIRPGGLCHR